MRLDELGHFFILLPYPWSMGWGRRDGQKLYTGFLPLHWPGGRRGRRSPKPCLSQPWSPIPSPWAP